MDDLTLCKKIAEIEGIEVLSCDRGSRDYQFVEEDGQIIEMYYDYSDGCEKIKEEWNPLTNKDLLFDLMVKYTVTINYCISSVTNDDHHTSFEFASEVEIPRAILECIIEDNKEMSDE